MEAGGAEEEEEEKVKRFSCHIPKRVFRNFSNFPSLQLSFMSP
jgi:hypothetical protein